VLAVCGLQHAQHARCADRTAADHRLDEAHRAPLRRHEQLLVGAGRCRLAPVEAAHAPAVEVQQEGAAADARALRLHQGQHHLHGDRGVDRRAAGGEDLAARLGGQRIGRRRHGALRGGAGESGPEARGALGLCRGTGGRRHRCRRRR